MVAAAQRHRELIADFKTDGSRLRKPQVMRIGWVAARRRGTVARQRISGGPCRVAVWVRQW